MLTLSSNSNNNINTNNRNTISRVSLDNNSDYSSIEQDRFNNPNEEIIGQESSYKENGPYFIIKFYPNKCCSIFALILNLIPGGLGTMLLGINRDSKKYIIGGIIQFLLIDGLAIIGGFLLKKKEWFKKDYKKILPIFLFVTSTLFYLVSIYIGVINNFIFINTKRLKKYHAKEFGLFILLLNLIIPGSGTLMIQSIVPNKCVIKMKRTLNGMLQLVMFIILFLYFCGLEKMNDNLLLFIFLAVVEYLYVIGISICFLRNITISDNIVNEIEINDDLF